MRKILILLIALFSFSMVSAKEVNVYLFYGEECPHCEEEQKYLSEISKKYDFNLIKYEVWHSEENAKLLKDVKEKMGVSNNYVPFTVIDTLHLTGFNDNTKINIEDKIEYCLKNDCFNILNEDGKINEIEMSKEPVENKKFNLPFFGEIEASDVSLPLLSIVLGFIDGFNPCAMWILIFLISLLISANDKKRMKILGSIFLLTSGIIYLLFMLAWLNISIQINKIIMLRNIIAMIAIIVGIINLKKFYVERKKDVGCLVTNEKGRKKIIARIKQYVSENSLFLAIIGIMALAVSVNLIELACSAGIPLLFTQVLTLNNLSDINYFIYILIYIIFFLIDDLIVFLIAVKTSEVKGISNKYTKYSHLIGGIIMALIGILLLVKPEIIMFNF